MGMVQMQGLTIQQLADLF